MALASLEDAADHDGATGRNAQVIPPARFMADLADTVRVFCKVRGKMTIGQLARRAGISERRMEKLIHNDPLEQRQASGSELLSIWAVLGSDAASHGLASIAMVAAQDEDTAADAALGLAVADFFDAGADIARAAANGRIDADEAEETLRACDLADRKTAQVRRAAHAAKRTRRGAR